MMGGRIITVATTRIIMSAAVCVTRNDVWVMGNVACAMCSAV